MILAGGWAHPPGDSVAAATRLISADFEPIAVTDPEQVVDALELGCELLVVSACWFSMTDDRYTAEQRAEFAVARNPDREAALDERRVTGCPLLALHTAVICFDGWQPWGQWLGGSWNWETSWHPPPAALAVHSDPDAPIGFAPFTIVDKEYQGLTVAPDVQRIARSANGNPLAWFHDSGEGRAAVNVLGHDSRSLDDPSTVALNTALLDLLVRR